MNTYIIGVNFIKVKATVGNLDLFFNVFKWAVNESDKTKNTLNSCLRLIWKQNSLSHFT